MTTVNLELWHLITLLVAGISGLATAGKLLLQQIDKRMDGHFDAVERAREASAKAWDTKYASMLEDQREASDAWRNLERDFLKFRGDLPLEYVRREDFIRNQSLIEAKLDAIALHIQNLQLQRIKNG
ncbi:MAG: hypothetical protein ROZ09_11475 [Thiobacillus sp.]|uniref:hypothetical protein n=1 Tax=Thiobacillus sp. TaxID=924 RepID=UPI002894D809|nr:hypothetical protein [Thiobacillus sp.]MDT3707439.1 hypothetical protein [Thiobacillus sp.]